MSPIEVITCPGGATHSSKASEATPMIPTPTTRTMGRAIVAEGLAEPVSLVVAISLLR